jgi:hypothetical protein
MDDIPCAHGSFDVLDLGNRELGLLGFPQAPLLPADWDQVMVGMKLACLQVVTICRLLHETLTMVGRDVLQLARVSLKMGKTSLPGFFWFFCL